MTTDSPRAMGTDPSIDPRLTEPDPDNHVPETSIPVRHPAREFHII